MQIYQQKKFKPDIKSEFTKFSVEIGSKNNFSLLENIIRNKQFTI